MYTLLRFPFLSTADSRYLSQHRIPVAMFLRKLRSAVMLAAGGGGRHKFPFKYKLVVGGGLPAVDVVPRRTIISVCLFFFLFFFSTWLVFIFFFCLSGHGTTINNVDIDHRKLQLIKADEVLSMKRAVCDGSMSVYMYELPTKFNFGLLENCRHLNVYTDMCPHVSNRGLGQPLHLREMSTPTATGSSTSWFATHQFIAEMIFHARVENHPCRTWEPNNATLFYVPFYGGLDASSKFSEADLSERDRLATELAEFLSQQPWWKKKNGRDHFLALGRTAWDFMRSTETGAPDFGANCLLHLPQVKNMSVLTVERHPWEGSNQFGIPYPSYFHPSTSDEMLMWQDEMRRTLRPYLFSFVGAPRVGVEKAAIRDEILKQCSESSRCNLLKCGRVGASKCHDPNEVLRAMSSSEFCMQAPGDSFTRRSTFDSILTGCIPVFFSPHTAYTQYSWFLPKEPSDYSVYIPEDKHGEMEEQLFKIPRERVERMRKTVIDLIPSITYIHPNLTDHRYLPADAVDLALAHLSKHVLSNTVSLDHHHYRS